MKKKNVEQKLNKAKALETESNLTLVSATVAIVSFFMMLYVHNAVTTNFIEAQGFLSIIQFVLLVIAVATGIVAVWKKYTFLWEYAVVALVLCTGYYLLENGVSGIPGLVSDANGTFTVSETAVLLSKIINTKTVIYALWAFNVVYCVFTIAYHSAKYTKIKKGNH